MNENEVLIVKVCDEEKSFEIYSDKKIDLEYIKKECIKKFNYSNEDINNINLWFINDNNDIKKINNDMDLIKYAKETDTKPSKYFIKLNVNKIIKDNIKIEKNQKDKEDDKSNKYYGDNLEKKYEKENIKLKKEIENLKLEINHYKERINILNNKLKNTKIENDIIIDDKLNNKFENLETEKISNIYKLNDSKVKKQLNNDKNKKNDKKYFLDNLEFINNKCKICNLITLESIYKCVICDNFFLCSYCHNNNSIMKIHEHNDFFEIKYPIKVITQIKEEKIIDNYYSILNSIFFENDGILSEKTFNVNTIQLEKICKYMKSIKADPYAYFKKYKKLFIINEIMKEPKSKITKIILEKEVQFLDKLNKINLNL